MMRRPERERPWTADQDTTLDIIIPESSRGRPQPRQSLYGLTVPVTCRLILGKDSVVDTKFPY